MSGILLETVLRANRIRNTFSSLEGDHGVRRRRVSLIYSKAYLRNSRHVQAIMSTVLQACRRSILEFAEDNIAIDFLSLSFAHGIDCMTSIIFGLPQATSFVHDTEKREDWLILYLRSHPPEFMTWMQELPNLMNWLIGMGVPVVPQSCQKARQNLESWMLELVDRTQLALEETPDEASKALLPSGTFPILYHHLASSLAKEDDAKGIGGDKQDYPRRRLELASEFLDHIGMFNILEWENGLTSSLVATRDTFGNMGDSCIS